MPGLEWDAGLLGLMRRSNGQILSHPLIELRFIERQSMGHAGLHRQVQVSHFVSQSLCSLGISLYRHWRRLLKD
jgi:hypothetical protein